MNDDLMDSLDEGLRKTVEEKHLVAIKTAHCREWKTNHSNCNGCLSELGCAIYVGLKMIPLIYGMYRPTSIADFEAQSQLIQEKMKNIMGAKTPDEARAIV